MKRLISKKAILLQALLGFFLQKIVSDLYSTIKFKLKEYGISHIDNQYIVGWMAEHDSNPKIRALASAKVLSLKTLRHLLLKEKDPQVRLALLRKLPSSDSVKEYEEAKSKKRRLEIIPLIQTQESLFRIASSENNRDLLKLILPKITDPARIKSLRRHSLLEVRNWADRKLWGIKERKETPEEREILKSILLSKKPNQADLALVQSPNLWYRIAKTHQSQRVQSIAVRNLEGNRVLLEKILGDQEVGIEIRMEAARLIGRSQMTVNLAQSDPNPQMRVQTVSFLDPTKDSDVLTKVMKYEKKAEVLTQAILTTTSLSDLKILRGRTTSKFPHLRKILEKREEALSAPLAQTS
jgi:hypothetical protein